MSPPSSAVFITTALRISGHTERKLLYMAVFIIQKIVTILYFLPPSNHDYYNTKTYITVKFRFRKDKPFLCGMSAVL
jgi:hypothetical protein